MPAFTGNFALYISQNWTASEDPDEDAAIKQRMLESFCEQYNYQEFIEDPDDPGGDPIPNPISRVQCFNQKIIQFIRETVRAARFTAAREAVEIEDLDIE